MASSGSPLADKASKRLSASKNSSCPIVASANQNLTHQIRTGVLQGGTSGRVQTPAKAHVAASVAVRQSVEHQQDSPVDEVGAADDILDPVEDDGSGDRKEDFTLIGEQPTGREGTAARQPAEDVRYPGP